MEAPRYPDDFEDWEPVDGWTCISGGHYLVLDSPDGVEQCCVHLDDGEVLGIRNKLTGRYRYERPEHTLAEVLIKTEEILRNVKERGL